jgi:hypothetical protein
VGASEAGLAAVERLLLDPQLSFNYITLLAPGGINVGGVAAQYTSSTCAACWMCVAGTLCMFGARVSRMLLNSRQVTCLPPHARRSHSKARAGCACGSGGC